MRGLARDTRKVWVSAYSSKEREYTTPTEGSQGQWTGEWVINRSAPFPVYGTVSAGRGEASDELFGASLPYTRTLTVHYPHTGISETSVVWIDTDPALDGSGNLAKNNDGSLVTPWEYAVTSVSETYNVTTVALKKVDIS